MGSLNVVAPAPACGVFFFVALSDVTVPARLGLSDVMVAVLSVICSPPFSPWPSSRRSNWLKRNWDCPKGLAEFCAEILLRLDGGQLHWFRLCQDSKKPAHSSSQVKEMCSAFSCKVPGVSMYTS